MQTVAPFAFGEREGEGERNEIKDPSALPSLAFPVSVARQKGTRGSMRDIRMVERKEGRGRVEKQTIVRQQTSGECSGRSEKRGRQ